MTFNLEEKLHEMENEVRQGIVEERLFTNYLQEHIVSDSNLYIWRDEEDPIIEKNGRNTIIRTTPLKMEYPQFPFINEIYSRGWAQYARPNSVFFFMKSISRLILDLENKYVHETLTEGLIDFEVNSLNLIDLEPAIDTILGIDYPNTLVVNHRQLFGKKGLEGFTPYWNMRQANILEQKGRNYYGQLGLLEIYWSNYLPPRSGLRAHFTRGVTRGYLN